MVGSGKVNIAADFNRIKQRETNDSVSRRVHLALKHVQIGNEPWVGLLTLFSNQIILKQMWGLLPALGDQVGDGCFTGYATGRIILGGRQKGGP